MQFRGDGLVLRAFTPADAPNIAAACRDADIARFIPLIPSPYTEEDARQYVDMVSSWDAGERRAFAIADDESGELLGSIDVRLGEIGSIGYWVAPAARGQGVATRALRLVSRWAVREQGVERLELTTHPENIASQRVAEKAGFQREGVLRAHTRFSDGRRDSVMFSLLPGDLS
ncbi:MAG: GNAT family N-acetyltransferase [Actinobacteria bacterium]|nr:GNAT family N-acetyltransferase [Actinomycetota bacterium]